MKKVRSSNFKDKRNAKVMKLINNGFTYQMIANKFGISKQRVYQIAKHFDYSRLENIKENKKQTTTNLNNDIEEGLSYKEIKDKYSAHYLTGLARKFRVERDIVIINAFKGGTTAKVITTMDDDDLDSPIRLGHLDSIYRITSKNGIKRYPMIGNRHKGGSFEDKNILKYIVNMRDENEWSYQKITDELNNSGKKTITGIKFTYGNVIAKYEKYKNKR